MNIKTRILLCVFLLELLGYGILLFYNHQSSKGTLANIRERQIEATMLGNAHRIDHLTNLMEHKVKELAVAGEMFYSLRKAAPSQSLEAEIKTFLVNSFNHFPESIGGGLWYEPNSFIANQEYFGPYVFWNKNKQVEFTWDLNTPEYDYHNQSWYLAALPKDWPRDQARPLSIYWTDPYWDEAGSKELMMTADAFVKDTQNHIVGLATVDWSLKEITSFISHMTITPNSKSFLIDLHSDYILSNTLFPDSVMSKRKSVPWLNALDTEQLALGTIKKSTSIFINDTFYRIYYSKTKADLILGIVIPEPELNKEIEDATKQAVQKSALIVIIFILGMLVLLEVLFRPFQKVKDLIHNSIKISDQNHLDIKPVDYKEKNEFTSIIDAINLTYDQINHYTREIEQANKAKTTFLATMSHEIRTPMNAILGYTQILSLDKNIPAEYNESIRAIDVSGKHLLELLNDILDISKIESGAMQLYKENFFLLDALNSIASTFKLRCQQKNLLWHADLKIPADCVFCSDKAKFSQIIINLLGNSIKFTEQGSISLESFIQDNILHIYISDTGQGISQSQQSQLFTPFFQGNAGQMYGGTGLGLTIVKKLVTLLNGNIKLKSQEFKGTRFEIFIPLEKENFELPNAKHNHTVQMNDFSQHQLTALVVDDVKINCDILTKVLSKLGIKSMQAANGVEALEIIKISQLDILFIDIQMPVMDGFELLERIKQLYPHLLPRTIAISANVYHIDNDYLGRGFQYYITKPFLINEISETVEDILEKFAPDHPQR